MDLEDDQLLREWEDDTPFILNEFDSAMSSQLSSKGDTFLKKIDEDLDYAFALSLQTQYDDEVKENVNVNPKKPVGGSSGICNKDLSIVDEQWELVDPHPDIHALFIEYDNKFFYGKLKGVEVRWSPRMTLCAGVCSYEGRGGLCSVRLSTPLLKLRPRRDLVETLLHEMIHAYLFVTHNNRDRDGHGPEFLSHMNRINKETGTRITVYHSFHDEVDLYRQHWWKCDGPCKNRRPFYGLVKRAMNRAPGPKDNWWAAHQASCGGNFEKIKEPENYSKKKATKRKNPSVSESKASHSDIRNFLKDDIPASNSNNNSKLSTAKSPPESVFKSLLSKQSNVVTFNDSESIRKKAFIPFQGTGQKLGEGSKAGKLVPSRVFQKNELNSLHKESSFFSSPSKKSAATPLPKTPKYPKFSNSADVKDVYKDEQPSTSSAKSRSIPKKLIQSPIKKFLSSDVAAKNSEHYQKNVNPISLLDVEDIDISQVSCPVCFILVKEQEINSHLDKCLLNN